MAPWIGLIFLLPLPFSLVVAVQRRNLLDSAASLDRIRDLPWTSFEHLVGEAYRRRGYRVTERGGSAPDGGVDLELRTSGKLLLVQCKRWRERTVGVATIRELYGVMTAERGQGAILVTCGRFTPEAIDFARNKPLELIDGEGLFALVKSTMSAKSTEAGTAAVKVPPIITTKDGPVTCPQCGEPMEQRVGRRGNSAGRSFWGCTQFPSCRGSLPLGVRRGTNTQA